VIECATGGHGRCANSGADADAIIRGRAATAPAL
jgi:hypothetical protein